ncbi:unnamed protein product [Rotaria sp. Silwood2]|nr:unnamed protein product [Rotaria sp. Silwood2]CAF2768567.1 unnamed protein product [Rotaria sp. Silwood2]CAF3029861.1 unnamed protein product [Rotaria sp. Silwood2]CAF3166745.1 unnamed protein product [Rotaria sp. Silwood2]CAF3997163.1 unnamed protein product [Rotaria sp. Silwood2]
MQKVIIIFIALSTIQTVLSQLTVVDVSTQALCTQTATLNPDSDARWAQAGLDTNIDWVIECGEIVAYKLEWFPVGSGKWSGWYVVGVNDIDPKAYGPLHTLKRMWSYFADHRHTYIICKQNKFVGCKCKI